jgi:hypothetical protein
MMIILTITWLESDIIEETNFGLKFLSIHHRLDDLNIFQYNEREDARKIQI